MQPNNLLNEIQPVINNGACVGCGACAFAAPEAVKMERDRDGVMFARVHDPSTLASRIGGVCPMGDVAANEDEHASALWPDLPNHQALGRHASCFVGSVVEGSFRAEGSSGGLATWIVTEALSKGLVDAVVHVHPAPESVKELFVFTVSRSLEAVRAGAKSRYYSVSMEAALAEAMSGGGRFALVGVPCTIKAARNLAARDQTFSDRLGITLSLVCGHMKAASFAESLAWQSGVKPNALAGVDFRVKQPGHSANDYAFSATTVEGDAITRGMASLTTRRWDGGYHRVKACDWCDDVFGETADITIGDAWLPGYVQDDFGNNVVIVRSAEVLALIEPARDAGRLLLEPLDAETAASSQYGGLRDRRDGLAYRLWIDDRYGRWHPSKRVTPGADHLHVIRRVIYRLRRFVRGRSFASFRFAKRIGTIRLYQLEMTWWHACFRLLEIIEKRSSFSSTKK